jgi:transglutaminase-like putative cysteine protease
LAIRDPWHQEVRGWGALDPTNSTMTGNHHIALARGRGNAGIFPVAGSREQNVDVQVDVVPRA